jgi:hypothetical protein
MGQKSPEINPYICSADFLTRLFREKEYSSTNCAGRTEYPLAKQRNWTFISRHLQKLTQNGSMT